MIDVITLEVLSSAFANIAEEMGAVLVNTAFSTNIKERKDCSAAILTSQGETLAQAEHVPLHLGSMLGLVGTIRNTFDDDNIEDGDVFIANDPYLAGGTHLTDITLATPIFANGKLVCWVADIAHHAEVGLSRSGPPVDIYDEGLRLTPLKLVRAGVRDEAFLNMFLANCRIPEERIGDIQAQMAAIAVGKKRMHELYEKYAAEILSDVSDRLLFLNEQRVKRRIAELPDGSYSFSDFMDDDGVSDTPIKIAVTITIDGNAMKLDFSDCGDQVAGDINVPSAAVTACVFYAIKATLCPSLPPNGGHFRAVTIKTRPGSILEPESTRPVQSRSDTCQRIVDVILGALAQVCPEKVTAAWNGCILGCRFSGIDRRNGRYFFYSEVLGGGGGASAFGHGLDAVQAHMTNTSLLPVESLEAEFPLRIERTSLTRPAEGGRGKFNGGRGIVRQVRVLQDGIVLSMKGDRVKHAPYGLFGGEQGSTAGNLLNPGTPHEKQLNLKVRQFELKAGDVVKIWTAGGGGYGVTEID